jgi:SAM-dependent methyltransferase
MDEPYLTAFADLVRSGAGGKDIFDTRMGAWPSLVTETVSRSFVDREIGRVDLHRQSVCTLLEAHIGQADSVVDVGCSTGGATVALALSRTLWASEVVGVDPNVLSLRAAETRARGYGLPSERVWFRQNQPGHPLPFSDDRFDLTVCVSVLEFVPSLAARQSLVRELRRVTRPGGYIFVATPNPLRILEYHTGRLLGDHRPRSASPWASSSRSLRAMLNGLEPVSLTEYYRDKARKRFGGAISVVPSWCVSKLIQLLAPWQKYLCRKPRR